MAARALIGWPTRESVHISKMTLPAPFAPIFAFTNAKRLTHSPRSPVPAACVCAFGKSQTTSYFCISHSLLCCDFCFCFLAKFCHSDPFISAMADRVAQISCSFHWISGQRNGKRRTQRNGKDNVVCRTRSGKKKLMYEYLPVRVYAPRSDRNGRNGRARVERWQMHARNRETERY